MLLSLSRDAAAINAVINNPAVRPFVGAPDAGYLDFSQAVTRSENWFLMGAHGGFGLTQSGPVSREIHVFIAPEGRGKWAAEAVGEAFSFAESHGVQMLIAHVARDRRDLALYARRAGMKPTGETVPVLGKLHDVFSVEFASCLPQ